MTAKVIKKMQAEQSACVMDCTRVVDEMRNMILSGALKPGTKLQAEKKLSENFCASVYVIRMALKQLKQEKLLYSRPKFGIFVAEIPQERKMEMESVMFAPDSVTGNEHDNHLQFITQSCHTKQRKMFSAAIAGFRRKYPLSEIDIIYSNMGEGITHDIREQVDVVETGIPIFYSRIRHEMLPLKQYFPDRLMAVKDDPTAFPFYFATSYMCYNPEMLAKLHCPLPAYRTFDEQTAYWKMVTECIKKARMPLPGILFPMVNLLGDVFQKMLHDLREGNITEESFIKKYRKSLDRATSYLRKYHISLPRLATEKTQIFQRGETPLLFTYSAHTVKLRQCCNKSSFAIYPVLTLDDHIFRETVPLSVRKTACHTVESVKFIEYLQNDSVTQQNLAELGCLPLSEQYYKYLPIPGGDQFHGSTPRFLVNHEDYYLCFNILNVELCSIVLFDKKIDDALRDTFQFARAYLNLQMDLLSQKLQEKQGNYFI